VIALDPTHFGWDASTSYLAAGGDFVQPTDIRPYAFTFFVSGAGSEFLDATSPPSGVGSWYLWSADCPQHSWSSGGAGECATGEGSPGCIPGGRDGALP
jgi:hypothetical protein